MLLMEHEIKILSGLLVKYANTEAPSNGSIEARIPIFHEQNKDNLNKVTSMTLGRSRTQSKNKLVVVLLAHVEASGLAASIPDSFMYQGLWSLAALENRSRAEGPCQIPPYGERRAQMETVLKPSVTSSFHGEGSSPRFATS